MIKFASDDIATAAKDPVIAAALAARARLDAAFAAQDVETVASLFADDLLVNTPRNLVARREAVLGFFKAGGMNYESADETIEAVEGRDGQVVVMGEEIIRPKETTAGPHAGKIVRRRFTDVWRKEMDGHWRLTIRQATVTSVA